MEPYKSLPGSPDVDPLEPIESKAEPKADVRKTSGDDDSIESEVKPPVGNLKDDNKYNSESSHSPIDDPLKDISLPFDNFNEDEEMSDEDLLEKKIREIIDDQNEIKAVIADMDVTQLAFLAGGLPKQMKSKAAKCSAKVHRSSLFHKRVNQEQRSEAMLRLN